MIFIGGENIFVHGKSNLTKNTILKNNIHLNGCTVGGKGKVIIGNNFHSGRDLLIITSNHNYDQGEYLPYDHTIISKDVIIEDNVWIGQSVIILPGVKIGEGAVIQAGSVVALDIPKLAIAGGSPAKPFKYRNENHYYRLKKEKRFY